MDAKTQPVGSPITLTELKALGEFVRWQDIEARIAGLASTKALPNGYPIVASRLPSDGTVDLRVGDRWRRVKFLRMERDRTGERTLVYEDAGEKRSARYDWYGVAPAGDFSEWSGQRPQTIAGAELTKAFELAQQNHIIKSQRLVEEDWPYLTIEAVSFDPNARWVDLEDMWTGNYTVHAADPRVKVPGITPREAWFNTTVAVSHRWLSPDHPDPNGLQYNEFMALCEDMNFHDNQTFLIDYCSLPQQPRSREETAWFRENLPGFQTQFKFVTLALNTGCEDYAKRAWCMLELILASMSRTPEPTLLNHDRLDGPLNDARRMAQEYVKHSIWNRQGMMKAFAGGLTNASYAKWARDPVNVGLYNASLDMERAIVGKFETELEVTNPEDRPIILDLLKRLAFS